MTGNQQTTIAILLFLAAGVLLARQIYRRFIKKNGGKDSGCSCSLPPRRADAENKNPDENR